MAVEIAGAISALLGAKELLVNAVAARDGLKIQTAVSDITGRLFDVQNAGLALQERYLALMDTARTAEDRVRELETEIASLKAQIQDRARYQLRERAPGMIVYALREDAANGDPMHYLCQTCMDNAGQKSVLQIKARGVQRNYFCPTCSTDFSYFPSKK